MIDLKANSPSVIIVEQNKANARKEEIYSCCVRLPISSLRIHSWAPTSVLLPIPTLLSAIPEPCQEPGLFAAQVQLLNKHHRMLSTYIAKVSVPGYSLHGNRSRPRSRKRWLKSRAGERVFPRSKGRNGWEGLFLRTLNVVCKARNVPVVQFPLLFTKVKLWIKGKCAICLPLW